MATLSELISKPVLNLYSGKIEGTIIDAVFDKNLKKIIKLKIFDEYEDEYLLETNKLYCIGKNMCVIKNSEHITPIFSQAYTQPNNPINKTVYSTTGEEMGKITDVTINENFEVLSLETINTKLTPNKILNIAENIIVNLENKQIKLGQLKPKIKGLKTNNVVSILPQIENPKKISETTKKEPYKINANPLPSKLSSNVQFLIGRKVSKTIYGINNEIIIKKDSFITTKNLENAKKHSKLAELTLYSQINA